MIEGVDLYHGDAMVDPSAYDFVFHKATQGTWFTDPVCQERIAQVRQAGKLAGMYHFMTTSDPIAAQVDFFLQQANPQMGDVLTLDFENDGKWANLAPLDIAAMGTQFVNLLIQKAQSHRVLLYCNKYTYMNYVVPFNVPIGDGLWIADVGSEPTLGLTFWQYASDTVDHDRGFFDTANDAHLWANKQRPIVTTNQQTFLLLED